VRVAVKAPFFNELNRFSFFRDYRSKGIEPSNIPLEVAQEVIDFVMSVPENEAFKVEQLENFKFSYTPSSFKKEVCESCGEMVFEKYLRYKDGKTLCIPCSGYEGIVDYILSTKK